jgi:hypothetical protein
MAALVKGRLRGSEERRIGKRTHGDSDHIGAPLGLPEHCRAAIGAKVKVHRKAAVGGSSMSSKNPIRRNVRT